MEKTRHRFNTNRLALILGLFTIIPGCNLINKDTCADSECDEITLYFNPVVTVKKASDLSPAGDVRLNCVYSKELCNGNIKSIYKYTGQTDSTGVFINETVVFKVNNKRDKLKFDAVLHQEGLKGNNFDTKIFTFSEFNHMDTMSVFLHILMD
jgi:hypothetical protein